VVTQTVPITGAVLRWARDEAGLSVAALAEQLTVSAEQIRQWEIESEAPSKGQVTKLAKALRRPSAVFFLPAAPARGSISPSLRSAPGLGDKPLQGDDIRAIRRAQRQQAMLSWCVQQRGSPPVDLPRLAPDADAAEAGEDARSRSMVSIEVQFAWRNDGQALRTWKEVLERQGIFVQQASLGRDCVRGLSLWDDYAPLVVVNSAYIQAARSYSLMHEYGHMLNRGGAACRYFVDSVGDDRQIERWCERFAASFLVPEDALKQVAASSGITASRPTGEPRVVRKFANRFRVSGRAMAIRLTDVGLGTRDLYSKLSAWSKLRDWNRQGGGGGEPRIERRRRELGDASARAYLEALDGGRLNLRDVTDFLGLSPNEIAELEVLLASE
jgi:Zn-dependent peptidase ImmA (M78 family)/transcriptional regulator with XRE-family HTH domain